MLCGKLQVTPAQLLFEAASTNDVDAANRGISRQKHANVFNENLDTPVHVAIRNDSMEVLEVLLSSKVDLKLCNKKGNAPLHEATMLGRLEAVRMLLHARVATKNAADPNQMQGLRLENKQRPLWKRTLLTIVDFSPAWRSGPPHRPLKTRGWSALHIAVKHNDTEIMEELIQAGADVNDTNEFERTPLHIAAYGNHVEAALLLLIKDANPDARDSKGDTPLHDAVAHDHVELTKILLYFGASNDIANNDGRVPSQCAQNMTMANVTTRPLHVAVASGQAKLVEGLLSHGAAVNETGIMGETALHLAAAHGDVDTAKLLLEYGADINGCDADYNTPLHYAAGYSQIDMVTLLLENGASRHDINMDGKTPKQLVPVSRARPEQQWFSPSRRPQTVMVDDDVHLKLARRVMKEATAESLVAWRDAPKRETTRYSIRQSHTGSTDWRADPSSRVGGGGMSVRGGVGASSRVAPVVASTRTLGVQSRRLTGRKGKPSKAASRIAEAAALAAVEEAARREEQELKDERAAEMAATLHKHMMRLRPWGHVIPPLHLKAEAIEAALDELDGPGAGAAARKDAHEEFHKARRQKRKEAQEAEWKSRRIEMDLG